MKVFKQQKKLKHALSIIDDWAFDTLDESFYRPNLSLLAVEQNACFITALRRQVIREGLPHIQEVGIMRDVLTRNLNLSEDYLSCFLSIYGRIIGFVAIATGCILSSVKVGTNFLVAHQSFLYLSGFLFLTGIIWIQSLLPKHQLFAERIGCQASGGWSSAFCRASLDIFRIQDTEFRSEHMIECQRALCSSPEHRLILMNRILQKKVLNLKSQMFLWEWVGLGIPAALLLAPWVLRVIATSS